MHAVRRAVRSTIQLSLLEAAVKKRNDSVGQSRPECFAQHVTPGIVIIVRHTYSSH